MASSSSASEPAIRKQRGHTSPDCHWGCFCTTRSIFTLWSLLQKSWSLVKHKVYYATFIHSRMQISTLITNIQTTLIKNIQKKKGKLIFFFRNFRGSLHWVLIPGPSVYKTDALPLSYKGICWYPQCALTRRARRAPDASKEKAGTRRYSDLRLFYPLSVYASVYVSDLWATACVCTYL